MSKLAKGGTVKLPAPTMGVDWSLPSDQVQYPFSPMSYDWIADGGSVKMRDPDVQFASTQNYFHLATHEASGKLVAYKKGSPGSVISYDPETTTEATISALAYSFTDHCNYQGRVFLSQTGGAHSWDGTTFVANAFGGASGGTDPSCCIYRDRYMQVQSTTLWYGGVGAVAGTVAGGTFFSFSLASYYTLGEMSGIAPITINDSSSLADYLLITTTGGDVLVFTGDFPGSANWQLVVRTRIPTAIPSPTYRYQGITVVPYQGDAFIVNHFPIGAISAKALIERGPLEAEKESPLGKVVGRLRRNQCYLETAAYHRLTNSLILTGDWSGIIEESVFGDATEGISDLWPAFLNVDLTSGAISPFFSLLGLASVTGRKRTKMIAHSDGQVYAVIWDGTSDFLTRILSKGTALSLRGTNAKRFLQFPYSDLGLENTIKHLLMAYPIMSVMTGSVSQHNFGARVSFEFDGDRAAVQSFETRWVTETANYVKRMVLPIAGQGNLISLALTTEFDSSLYANSISIQFEDGGPY